MKNLKSLFPYLKKHNKQFLLGFVFVTISNLGSTYIPRLVGKTIDMISQGQYHMDEIYLQLFYILLMVLVSGTFMVLTRRTIIVASREIEYEIRKDLLEKVQNYPMNFFHRTSTGSLMAHANNDIPAAREFIGPAIMYSANTITTFIFALYFMISLNLGITIIGLLPLPFVAYGTYILGKRIHIAFKDVQEQFGELTTQAQESISGIRVVRAYVREFFENSMFRKISESYLKKNLRLAKIEAFMMPSLMILIGISQVAVLAYGGFMVIAGNATIGDLTQFFIYLNLLIWPVAAIGWVTNLIQRAAASALRLEKLMSLEPEREDINIEIQDIDLNGDIVFENVSLKYNEDSPEVLKNINLRIKKGQTLGILGSVGSGKSSLGNLVSGLFNPTEGRILLNGIDTALVPLEAIRTKVGVVPQDSFLFSTSILDNIKFGAPDSSFEEIIEISKKSQLYDEVFTFEDNFNTLLGERGITLSGGQKQRVAIARAMITDPQILILDDALSALDTHTEEKLLAELREFMKERTTIIISHRISSIKDADNIITLEDGKIIEMGSHNQLIALKGVYSNIYNKQMLEEELEILDTL